MKRNLFLLLAAVVLGLAACMKHDDHDGANHDDSPLMQLMMRMDDSMAAVPMTMDADHDFAAMMKVHHQGAVQMADYELTNGSDATIKGIAQRIKDAQTSEIAMLDSFLAAHAPMGHSMAFDSASDAAMNKMMADMRSVQLNGKTDHDFVHLMILHHQSAIDMAKAEQQYGMVQRMKDFAAMVITDQEAEIAEFRAWLNAGND